MYEMKTLKNYKKLFSDFWGYCESDIPVCWGCFMAQAVDIHHLENKGLGGFAESVTIKPMQINQ